MFAMLFRCLAIALLLVCIILELVTSAVAANVLAALRDGGFCAFIASFLPLP